MDDKDLKKEKDIHVSLFYDKCVNNLEHYAEVVEIKASHTLSEIVDLGRGELYTILTSGQNTSDAVKITEYLDDVLSQIIYTNAYVVLIDNDEVFVVQDEKTAV